MKKDNIRFAKLYRHRIKVEDTSKAEIKEFIDELELCTQAVNAGVNLSVIQRRTGLTIEEVANLPNNKELVVEELNLRSKYMKDVIRVTADQARRIMNRNKQYIIKRLLLGDKMGDIVKDLGITGQAHVSRRFIALLEKEGYYVNKIAEYHKIYNDLVKRVPVEKLITKYEHFNSEMDIQKFIKLHGLNRVELVHEKEKMIIA